MVLATTSFLPFQPPAGFTHTRRRTVFMSVVTQKLKQVLLGSRRIVECPTRGFYLG